MTFSLLLPFLWALWVFLFGLILFEDSLNTLWWPTFKRFLQRVTGSVWWALSVGIIATAILHNSALISLVAISFTSARIMTLKSAFAMILWANIGTTFSGWTIALIWFNLNLQVIIYPLLFISGITGLLRWRNIWVMKIVKTVAWFWLLFLWLDMLKIAASWLSSHINLQDYIHLGVSGFFILWVLVTVMIQSSTLMRTLTMTALFSNIVSFEHALAIIIGANLGTTSTALIAWIGDNPLRKQVAMSQVIFNLVSSISIIGVPWFSYRMITYADASNNPTFALAWFDTVFNLFWAVLFIPIIWPFTRWLERLFPEK